MGLIAEEVYPIFPEAVPLDEKKLPFSVDYGKLMAPVIAAIQQLFTETAELRRENQQLRERLGSKS